MTMMITASANMWYQSAWLEIGELRSELHDPGKRRLIKMNTGQGKKREINNDPDYISPQLRAIAILKQEIAIMELQYEIALLAYESGCLEDNGDKGEVITPKEENSMIPEIEFEKQAMKKTNLEAKMRWPVKNVLNKDDKIQQDKDGYYNRKTTRIHDKDTELREKSVDNPRHHKRKNTKYSDVLKDDCEQHESNRTQRIMIKDVNDEWHDALFVKEVYTKITSANKSEKMIQRRKKDLLTNFSDKEEKALATEEEFFAT
ncbi:hypothetical protein Hanom_Chr00s000003g01602751 [Helianthus anomalus]